MSLSISDAMQQAHAAIDSGDYAGAAETCQRLVSQFPGYAAAYRLLGEAHHEQGHAADAQSAFIAAVTRDQRHPDGWNGLGRLAEDQGSIDAALAFCQVGWELAPQKPHLRDPLARLAMRRYASDGDLQLSRAALAQLYANTNRLHRAADEFYAALAELPDRVDLQLGLAETFWRLDEQASARRIAESVLEHYPESAQALIILADIEHRASNSTAADGLLRKLRDVDPDGAIVAEAIAANPHADGAWLALPADAMPTVRDEAPAPRVERPQLAPAPDFSYQPQHPEIPTPQMDELEPISLDEISALGNTLPAPKPAEVPADDIVLAEPQVAQNGTHPFNLADVVPLPAEINQHGLIDLGFEDFSEGAAAAEATDASDLAQLWQEDTAPAAVAAPTAESAPATGGTDDLDDLAAALQGDIADALMRNGEALPLAEAADMEQSRPPAHPLAGYTTVLRSLDDEGFAPFDPLRSHVPAEIPTVQTSATPVETPAMDAQFTDHWDTVDVEIADATPSDQPHGYTDELQTLEAFGLEPFTISDTDEEITPFDPVSATTPAPAPEPESAPTPAPAPVPTPSQSAAPVPTPAPTPSPVPSVPVFDVDPVEDDLLVGLEPFSFDEIEQTRTLSNPAAFSTGPSIWDDDAVDSVVPSDEDLDAMLALGGIDDVVPAPAPPAAEPVEEPFSDIDAGFSFDDVFASGFQTVRLDAATTQAATDASVEEESVPTADRVATDTNHAVDDAWFASGAATRVLDSDHADTAWSAHDNVESDAVDTVVDTTTLPELAFSTETSTLHLGTELFDRARVVKEELVSEGVIAGDRELVSDDTPSVEEPLYPEDAIDTRQLTEDDLLSDETANIHQDDSDDFDMPAVGSVTRDTETLRAALEVTPNDDELHWWLAEALREQGDTAEALSEYRWLIRNAPTRHDDVLNALESCVVRNQETETAHRLLADIYRRRGDATRASNHAAQAMQSRRLSRVR